jgi:hypothetical protein
LVRRLIGDVERLRAQNEKLTAALAAAKLENQQLKDEIRGLNGVPLRPPIKPSCSACQDLHQAQNLILPLPRRPPPNPETANLAPRKPDRAVPG